MKSMTSTRNTTTPITARWPTCLPQLALISDWEISFVTGTVSSMTATTWSLSSGVISSTWTRRAPPAVVTMGDAVPSMPESAIASRTASAFSCETSLEARGTRYWVPPVNSMPKAKPLTRTMPTATATRAPEMRYQSPLRWTKSIDRRQP